jgi:DNA polymerase I-like protein with 3'-5' exonuclease and polymerase domains
MEIIEKNRSNLFLFGSMEFLKDLRKLITLPRKMLEKRRLQRISSKYIDFMEESISPVE